MSGLFERLGLLLTTTKDGVKEEEIEQEEQDAAAEDGIEVDYPDTTDSIKSKSLENEKAAQFQSTSTCYNDESQAVHKASSSAETTTEEPSSASNHPQSLFLSVSTIFDTAPSSAATVVKEQNRSEEILPETLLSLVPENCDKNRNSTAAAGKSATNKQETGRNSCGRDSSEKLANCSQIIDEEVCCRNPSASYEPAIEAASLLPKTEIIDECQPSTFACGAPTPSRQESPTNSAAYTDPVFGSAELTDKIQYINERFSGDFPGCPSTSPLPPSISATTKQYDFVFRLFPSGHHPHRDDQYSDQPQVLSLSQVCRALDTVYANSISEWTAAADDNQPSTSRSSITPIEDESIEKRDDMKSTVYHSSPKKVQPIIIRLPRAANRSRNRKHTIKNIKSQTASTENNNSTNSTTTTTKTQQRTTFVTTTEPGSAESAISAQKNQQYRFNAIKRAAGFYQQNHQSNSNSQQQSTTNGISSQLGSTSATNTEVHDQRTSSPEIGTRTTEVNFIRRLCFICGIEFNANELDQILSKASEIIKELESEAVLQRDELQRLMEEQRDLYLSLAQKVQTL